MFQFPGFALKPLCIQGKSTWFTPLMITPKDDNNGISGGFPHSDISGSKPIPGSPKLNAGYHVLHRLLLPRHPPNALFALDLTRKEQGRWFKVARITFPASKVVYLPMRAANAPEAQSPHTVSVLDLEQYHLSGSDPQASPYSGRQMILMFLTLNDVNSSSRTSKRSRDRLLVRPSRQAQWWVEEDLNLRPHAYQACALTT